MLKKKISQGSFGVVYAGEEINSRVLVAIKVEKEFHEDSSLDREVFLFLNLRQKFWGDYKRYLKSRNFSLLGEKESQMFSSSNI